MVTQRIRDFLAAHQEDGPCVVIDLEVIRENYQAFRRALPDTRVFYAIKANPDDAILNLLADEGSSFDCASLNEIKLALAAGASADRISFGNTIKKQKDIAAAFQLGVRLFAVDSVEEVKKVAVAAPGSMVFCRILADGDGAEWPLSRKFGCTPEMAVEVLDAAHELYLVAHGVSFHVGSQMTRTDGWETAIESAKWIFSELEVRGITLKLVNLGGGFPAKYLKDIPTSQAYGDSIMECLRRHFGNNIPETIIEPGRGMCGAAGAIQAEVVLISKKSFDDAHRWVYLDIGKYGGLAETMEEAIRYPILTPRDGATAPCVIAGPTCDSADVLYEHNMYELPLALEIGDKVIIDCAGVYTTTYSAVAFNGFEPLKSYVI